MLNVQYNRVLACWDGQPQMYPGRVLKLLDQACSIKWEDGTEPTDVPLNQLARIKPAGK